MGMIIRLALIIVALVFLFPAKNVAQNFEPLEPVDSFLDIKGPCYKPNVLAYHLLKHKFHLIADAESQNRGGITGNVYFYSNQRNFIVVLVSEQVSCVLLTGANLNFGV